jgi:hypothetical protein
MTDFLDGAGEVRDRHNLAAGARDHLGSIVTFVTSRTLESDVKSPVRCRRRPRRRPCRGWIRARRDPDTDEIVWTCPVCREQGAIRGWRGTPWDLSALRSPPARRPIVAGPFTTTSRAVPDQPRFSAGAARVWAALGARNRILLLNNVWCRSCRGGCSMQLLAGRMYRGHLTLEGRCVTCGAEVARLVETS